MQVFTRTGESVGIKIHETAILSAAKDPRWRTPGDVSWILRRTQNDGGLDLDPKQNRPASPGRTAGEKDRTKSLLRVTAAQHRGEGHDLVLAALSLRRLLGIALGAHVLDDALTLELLLHATQRTVDRLILTHFDLDGHGEREGFVVGKGHKEPARLPTVNSIFLAPAGRILRMSRGSPEATRPTSARIILART